MKRLLPLVLIAMALSGTTAHSQTGVVTVKGNTLLEGGGDFPRVSLALLPRLGGSARKPLPVSFSGSGTFSIDVPEGDYDVSWALLPAGYRVKSITSGSVNVLDSSLKVLRDAPPGLTVTLEKTPSVRVSGRVTGLPKPDPSLPSSVALVELAGSARHETTVSEDGSFTFPAIPTGIYLARLNSVERFTRPVPVSVLTSDISGVVIGVTPAKEIKVRLSMNRGSRRPDALSLRSGAWPGMIGVPQPDGTFSFSVPEGSNRIEIYAVDYEVLEMKYGSIDLLKEPLNVSAADTVEVLATLGRIPSTDAYLWGLERPATNVYVAIQGGAASATCLECPSPEYPALARTARISDTIALAVVVGNDGQVSNPRVISGHQLLQQAAVDAVKKWRFVPLAAGVSLRVFLVFRFDQQA